MAINGNRINAAPTKDFFINMLVRDIPLIKAIADLVDNCIDGALRIRAENKLDDLWVRIQLNGDYFEITDNCGGFSSEIARNYAFRFGRPLDAPGVNHSIGRFGVGMKRSLFKLGNKFTIASKSKESRFLMDIDVLQWQKNLDPQWFFDFSELDESPQEGEFGTSIKVTDLHPDVAEQFLLESFINSLRKEIQIASEKMMERGLAININGVPLTFNPTTIFFSDEIRPAFFQNEINNVSIKAFAGLGKPEPKEAGWYIYCNGRLVVQADKTAITSWGDGIPVYTNTFARFRGYVFFDSDNSVLLPWNTTKSGIDQDSGLYRAIKLEMATMMRPVINFLYKLADEKKEGEETLEIAISNVNSNQLVTNLNTSNLTKNFEYKIPVRTIVVKPSTQTIKYEKPISQIDKIKKLLKVSTLKEVGEKTFEYFYNSECDD